LFVFLFAVVGVVAGVDSVGDDEELNVLEKSKFGAVRVALVAVDLVECFFEFESSAFEFDLGEGESVD
jgi:hypothetical protein